MTKETTDFGKANAVTSVYAGATPIQHGDAWQDLPEKPIVHSVRRNPAKLEMEIAA
jgi:hypothetical protein